MSLEEQVRYKEMTVAEEVLSKTSYEGFMAFVQNRPFEENIEHDDWSTCAMGEYLKSLNITTLEAWIHFRQAVVMSVNPDLGRRLLVRTCNYKTYGELFHAMEQHAQAKRQEVLDKAVKTIVKQGGPAFRGGLCRYRYEGKVCAIGAIILDEVYTSELERQSVRNVGVIKAIKASGYLIDFRSLEFYYLLQRCHDIPAEEGVSDFVPAFLGRVREVALNFNLTMPDLEEPDEACAGV